MIFNVKGHIEKIIKGEKTETRRSSGRYKVGQSYAVQPKRTAKAISEGRIRITNMKLEKRSEGCISWHSADAEGGYSPLYYEELYKKLNPKWEIRYAYQFKFEPLGWRVAEK